MGIDTIKVTFTYTIALIVIVGGMLFLYQTRADPTGKDVTVVVAGFVSGTLTWLFQSETATRTSRATERALMQSAPPSPGTPPG